MAVAEGKTAIAPDGKTSGKDIFDPSPDNRWSAFIAGSGQWLELDTDFNAPGYEITTGGLTLGADYRITDTFAVGLLTGYARSTAELNNDGHIRVNSGKLGLYATWFDKGCYLTGLVSGGLNDYEIKRRGLDGKPRGDSDGGEFNALLSAGHDFKVGAVTVGPIVEAQYNHVAYDGYREHGSVAPLDIESNDSDSVRTRIGARAAVQFRIGKIQIRPEARIAWEHEYIDQTRPTDSHFASGVGSTFRVEGPEHGRDSLLVNASITLLSGERASVYIAYDGLLARDGYESHSISGGFQWSF
jgi:outer membrane autotransporter protein